MFEATKRFISHFESLELKYAPQSLEIQRAVSSLKSILPMVFSYKKPSAPFSLFFILVAALNGQNENNDKFYRAYSNKHQYALKPNLSQLERGEEQHRAKNCGEDIK